MIPAVAIARSASFRFLTRRFRGHIVASACALAASSVCALLGVAAQSEFLSQASARAETSTFLQFLPSFGRFLALQAAYEFTFFLRRRWQARLAVKGATALRSALFERLATRRMSEAAAGQNNAQLNQLFTADAPALAAVWAEGILAFASALALSFGVSAVLVFDLGWPGLVFGASLSILVFAARRFARQAAPIVARRAGISTRRLGLIAETAQAIPLVKSLRMEALRSRDIAAAVEAEERERIQLNALNCTYIPVFASLRWVAWFLVVMAVTILYSQPGTMPAARRGEQVVALLFAANWYSALLQDSFLWIGLQLNILSLGHLAAQRIDEFLALEPASAAALRPPSTPTTAVPTAPSQARGFRLTGVSTGYAAEPSPSRAVIRNLYLVLEPGTLTVVTGRLGSGKTTLLRLLAGELPAWEGTLEASREIHFLPQEPFLPSAHLRQAIRFDFADLPTGDAALLETLDAVAFLPDLSSLEGGLDAWVGERGVTLSGGQRQRLGLARFVSPPNETRPLLLDDPFSGLDPATYKKVSQHLLDGTWRGRTVVLASTRPNDLARATQVVFLTGDGAARIGTHSELQQDCPAYRQLLDDAGKSV